MFQFFYTRFHTPTSATLEYNYMRWRFGVFRWIRDRTCELGIFIGFWSVVDHRLRILPRFTITFVYIFLPIIFGGTRGGKVARIDPTIVNTQGNWRRLRNYCYYMRVQQTGTSEVAASSGLIQSTSSKSETKLVEALSRMSGALAPPSSPTPTPRVSARL